MREVIPAATVIVMRRRAGADAEVLMVERAKAMRFAGGAAVFPGGRIDPADRELAQHLGFEPDPVLGAARVAAIRETLEETGLAVGLAHAVSADEAARARALLLETGRLGDVLEAFGWTLDPGTLARFAHWCPPFERAFDTHFFVADLGTGAVEISVDETENTHMFWTTPAEALAMGEDGRISLIFPTRRNLERLAGLPDYAAVLADIAAHPVACIVPRDIMRDGEVWIEIPENAGYPVVRERRDTADRGLGPVRRIRD